MAKKTITKVESEIKTVRSSDWKEVYIDKVILTTDEHVTRIICANHYLDITGTSIESNNAERVIKVDLIVPNSALSGILTALSEVVKDFEKESIKEKKSIKKKTSVQVKDIEEQDK